MSLKNPAKGLFRFSRSSRSCVVPTDKIVSMSASKDEIIDESEFEAKAGARDSAKGGMGAEVEAKGDAEGEAEVGAATEAEVEGVRRSTRESRDNGGYLANSRPSLSLMMTLVAIRLRNDDGNLT